jgi:DHA1 family bicyclomycin/chloramphenicol resistance-like MFS transporter
LRHGADIPRAVTIALAGLISLGAVALDITLVALPATAGALGGEPTQSGLIITTFLAGFAPGQLLWGFLGDRIGRRRSVLAGLVCFVLATAACALAPAFGWLLAARCLQGIAAGVGPVMGRAIARDLASEIAGARLLALLTAVIGTVPLLAPLVGAALLAHMDWRSVFLLTALIGAVWFVIAWSGLPETRPAHLPPLAVPELARDTRSMFAGPDFRVGAALVAAPFAGYHTLLALYPGIAIVNFAVSEANFAWLFAAAAACFTLGSSLSRLLVARTGLRPLIIAAAMFCLSGGVTIGLAALLHNLPLLAVGAAAYVLGVGQVLPLGTTIALRRAQASAGWTAGLLGLLQVSGGAICSFVATQTTDQATGLAVILTLCGGIALAIAIAASQRIDRPAPAVASP